MEVILILLRVLTLEVNATNLNHHHHFPLEQDVIKGRKYLNICAKITSLHVRTKTILQNPKIIIYTFPAFFLCCQILPDVMFNSSSSGCYSYISRVGTSCKYRWKKSLLILEMLEEFCVRKSYHSPANLFIYLFISVGTYQN